MNICHVISRLRTKEKKRLEKLNILFRWSSFRESSEKVSVSNSGIDFLHWRHKLDQLALFSCFLEIIIGIISHSAEIWRALKSYQHYIRTKQKAWKRWMEQNDDYQQICVLRIILKALLLIQVAFLGKEVGVPWIQRCYQQTLARSFYHKSPDFFPNVTSFKVEGRTDKTFHVGERGKASMEAIYSQGGAHRRCAWHKRIFRSF